MPGNFTATFRRAMRDKEHSGNLIAQIWLCKVLYGLREKVDVELPQLTETAEVNVLDAAWQIAFTLAMGASIAKNLEQE